MEDQKKYEIKIFGQKFTLTTSDGQVNELKKVAEHYKMVVEHISQKLPNRSQLDVAILAGLKITDKLYSVLKSKDMDLDLVNERLNEIVNEAIKRLDISLDL
jgi:cell division protein ZapA (FtsZ GTPase activity inhibitor)